MTMEHGQFTKKPDVTQSIEPLDRWDGMTWGNPTTGELRVWDDVNKRWFLIDNNPRLFDNYQKGLFVSGVLASDGSAVSTCRALQFPDESLAVEAREVAERKYASATNSSEKGFVLGGVVFERVGFDSTSAVESETLETSKLLSMMPASASTAGYYMGGSASAQVTKLDFSSTTLGSGASELAAPRWLGGGVNSRDNGYVIGGRDSYGVNIKAVERLSFADETVSFVSAKQTVATVRQSCFNSTMAGYSVGGVYSDGTQTTTIDKFSFVNETSFVSCANITEVSHVSAVGVNSTVAGYVASGFNTGMTTKVSFADDAQNTLDVQISEPLFGSASFDSTDNNGYIH